jgi:hypothetical protein
MRRFDPGPGWTRIPGGWRHEDGSVVSDWIPRESGSAPLDIDLSALGEVSIMLEDGSERTVGRLGPSGATVVPPGGDGGAADREGLRIRWRIRLIGD